MTVADEGPGVPEHLRERVFERFARAEAARPRQAGAGLGLAICREIAVAHAGRIWIEDRRPHGSALVVALPRVAPPDEWPEERHGRRTLTSSALSRGPRTEPSNTSPIPRT